MELNKNNIKKIIFIGCSIVLFIFALFNFKILAAAFDKLMNVMLPFIIGFCIAFVVNVPMKAIENLIFRNKDSRFYKLKRPVSMVIAFAVIILIIAFAVTMVIPDIAKTIDSIGEKFPAFMDNAKKWVDSLTRKFPSVAENLDFKSIDWNTIMGSALDFVKNGGTLLITKTVGMASSVIGVFVNIFVGLFFAFYVLAQKETLKKQCKGLVYAIMKEGYADRFIKVCAMADQTFSNFISGQCLEACILGLLFFIVITIFGIPYALTISIVIAITALVPIVGAFIGCVVGGFLVLVDTPSKLILYIILFICVQQIEGNFIYPHVVGGSVGLPSIWVLVSVMVGGDLFGIVGMLVFVPLSSVVYALAQEFVIVRLKEKGIPRAKYIGSCVVPERFRRGRSADKKKSDKNKEKSGK